MSLDDADPENIDNPPPPPHGRDLGGGGRGGWGSAKKLKGKK